jgi:hypothetical protein
VTSAGRYPSAMLTQLDSAERVTRLLFLVQLIDDVLDALELWQSAGVTNGQWVVSMWSRRVIPKIEIELPPRVRYATETWHLYEALLAWQYEVVESLCAQRQHADGNRDPGNHGDDHDADGCSC